MNTTENPPFGDQGLAFQTHALQMILFGPFYVRPQTVTVRYEIVALQLLNYVVLFLLNYVILNLIWSVCTSFEV